LFGLLAEALTVARRFARAIGSTGFLIVDSERTKALTELKRRIEALLLTGKMSQNNAPCGQKLQRA